MEVCSRRVAEGRGGMEKGMIVLFCAAFVL